jgi:4-amino-4-deoxy-L-arabinose transferase-like glycosyltransferase
MTLIFFVLFLYYVFYTASQICQKSLIDWLLTSFILFAGSIIVTGFCLSPLHLTASVWAWALGVLVPSGVIGLTSRLLQPQHKPLQVFSLIANRWQVFKDWFGSLSLYLKCIFGLLFLTLTIVGVTNLMMVLFTPPNEWDSMTGHLNRVMQYIQRRTMAHFGGTNWNMDTYPKSVTTIQIYSFLMTGRFENALKLIHHLSYWVSLVAVFGIVQRIARNLTASFFCALAFSLFLDLLMQATTTDTDIVLAAYLSCSLYFLFSFKITQRNLYLYLAALSLSIAFGHKATFALLVPSVFVVVLYVFFYKTASSNFKPFFKFLAACIVCFCIWTLPTGYLKNIEVFGHPIGPPTALKHQSIERATSHGGLRNLFEQGSRNVLRYAFDFVNLDGFRNIDTGQKINRTMKKSLVWLEQKLKMRLDEETDFTIIPFEFERQYIFTNGTPYWGVLGFALIFPLLFLVLFGIVRSPVHWFLAIAVLLHFAALSYSAPYDPWKGRYFQETGIFAVLFLALLFDKKYNLASAGNLLLKSYVGLVVIMACLSAVLAIFYNLRALPFSVNGQKSIFQQTRMEVQTFARPDITAAYAKFDSIVPDTATVALGTINDDFEYPLFGKNLTRKLIPINPFEQGLQPIPKEADYLFFAKSVIKPVSTDLRLGTDTVRTDVVYHGEDYYLRKLRP